MNRMRFNKTCKLRSKGRKDLKDFIETCNARHTDKEKMVGLTGLLCQFRSINQPINAVDQSINLSVDLGGRGGV